MDHMRSALCVYRIFNASGPNAFIPDWICDSAQLAVFLFSLHSLSHWCERSNIDSHLLWEDACSGRAEAVERTP